MLSTAQKYYINAAVFIVLSIFPIFRLLTFNIDFQGKIIVLPLIVSLIILGGIISICGILGLLRDYENAPKLLGICLLIYGVLVAAAGALGIGFLFVFLS